MTRKKNPHDQGALVSAAGKANAARVKASADRRIAEQAEAAPLLDTVPVDRWEFVLERVRAGDTDSNIASALGLSSGAIAAKRRRDPAFETAYREALEDAWVDIAVDIRSVTRGVPGYSSGDVRRDALIAKYDLELAKRFANRVLGDRIHVDTQSVIVNLTDLGPSTIDGGSLIAHDPGDAPEA